MNKRFIATIVLTVVFYFFISYISDFYIDYTWFGINGGHQIFWVLFLTKFNIQMFFAAAFILLFMLNFGLVRVLAGKGRFFMTNFLDRIRLPLFGSSRRFLMVLLTAAIIFIGFAMGGTASQFWKEYLLYRNGVKFDGFPVDPIFHLDIGFYVFSLPFYNFVYGWLMSSLLIITVFSAILHFLNGGIFFKNGRMDFSLFCRAHISILLALIVVLYGTGYRLSSYELLFSQIGKFYGAGFTAVNSKLIAYRAAEGISFIAAALLLFNVFKRSFRLPIIVMITIIPVYFLLGIVYPALQQRFVVVPNELDKEKPYILNNIKFTRIAYGLDKIEDTQFENRRDLTYKDLSKNREMLESVRLWDWRPLKQTYKQLQEQKQYYFFNDVDVDRYDFGGKKIAVNLSARELSINNLSANSQTWQNKHLIYTHGYGVVMSRVDRISSEGLPEFLIRDIPPKSTHGLKIDRPEIYFGEHDNSYVITNTSIKPGEFDYPSGEENRYTTYAGSGGIRLDSFLKRLMAAVYFNDVNLLISGNIGNESRILLRRNIVEMVKTFAPLLQIDDDPYIVMSEGKLYWMLDAYTGTDRFPYSTPITSGDERLNYIRNSVKIIIDAYNGRMDFYITDPSDPIIRAHERMFPGMFKKFTDMPADLKAHIRYPETIFNIQSRLLLKYHMTNPNVFYNNEDAWDIPGQIYEGREEPVHSYYLVTMLPGDKKSGFMLILPFTPYKKNNMTAFLTAKCDPESYGRLKLFQLLKDKLNYGPMQIEARINQDPEISKQLTLWSQKGSSVIRGNMLAIPVEESLIFIEPLYLKAESSEMPELKKVIVSYSDRIVMEDDLPSSLEHLFGGQFNIRSAGGQDVSSDLRVMADRAYYHYMKAEEQMRAGNWKGYGEEIENLKGILTQMKRHGEK